MRAVKNPLRDMILKKNSFITRGKIFINHFIEFFIQNHEESAKKTMNNISDIILSKVIDILPHLKFSRIFEDGGFQQISLRIERSVLLVLPLPPRSPFSVKKQKSVANHRLGV